MATLNSCLVLLPTASGVTWLLALSQSVGGAPIRARPALAGVDRPDTGPPDDVIRTYLQRAQSTPQGGAQ